MARSHPHRRAKTGPIDRISGREGGETEFTYGLTSSILKANRDTLVSERRTELGIKPMTPSPGTSTRKVSYTREQGRRVPVYR